MKLVFSLVGIVLIVIAAIYFLVPADQLPTFFPGHEAGLSRIRIKHAVVIGFVGLVLILIPMVMRRR